MNPVRTNKAFNALLSKVNATLTSRNAMAHRVMTHPWEMEYLISTAVASQKELSYKAWWILERIYLKEPEIVRNFLPKIITSLPGLQSDSAMRPAAKIFASVLESEKFSIKQKEDLTDTFFRWLLGNRKVAVKVHAMSALYELGKGIPWIHGDLRLLLERDYDSHSAAFKARARRVLNQIKQYQSIA